MHGLYDGGVGAGLADYWNLVEKSPVGAGGVLWYWVDAGVARADKDGFIDTDGNYSADGIVGPRREKEASYFTIREIWSPVQIPLEQIPPGFDGTLPVENKYFFSTLEGTALEWKLLRHTYADQSDMEVSAEGNVPLPAIPPREKGRVGLPLPKDWQDNDVLVARANDANGDELMQWCWPLRVDVVETKQASTVSIEETGSMRFLAGGVTWVFDPETGHLIDCVTEGSVTGLGKGPVLYAGTAQSVIEQKGQWTVGTKWVKDSVVIASSQADSGSTFSWTLNPDGSATFDYALAPIEDALTYCAVGFDLP